jgi:sialate O-acetylesterase
MTTMRVAHVVEGLAARVKTGASIRPKRDRSVLVLTSPYVPNPIHFRYAWGRNPMANLQSADHNDLPFATQRSDDWEMEAVPLGVLGDQPFEGGKLGRAQRNQIRKVLQQEDLQRRITEARALLREHGELSEAGRDDLE